MRGTPHWKLAALLLIAIAANQVLFQLLIVPGLLYGRAPTLGINALVFSPVLVGGLLVGSLVNSIRAGTLLAVGGVAWLLVVIPLGQWFSGSPNGEHTFLATVVQPAGWMGILFVALANFVVLMALVWIGHVARAFIAQSAV